MDTKQLRYLSLHYGKELRRLDLNEINRALILYVGSLKNGATNEKCANKFKTTVSSMSVRLANLHKKGFLTRTSAVNKECIIYHIYKVEEYENE